METKAPRLVLSVERLRELARLDPKGPAIPFHAPETDCRIEVQGREFSSGGAWIDPLGIGGYCTVPDCRVDSARLDARGGPFTAWNGTILGTWRATGPGRRAVNPQGYPSCIGSRLYSIRVEVRDDAGRVATYFGIGFGAGMLLRARRCASERRAVEALIPSALVPYSGGKTRAL